VPHPHTAHVDPDGAPFTLAPPLVLKPRFGSWGRDVVLCDDEADVAATLRSFATRPWFASTGAIAQELLPPHGYDLRLVVSGGRPVGAVERVAAEGEWRTNVALGAARRVVEAPAEAAAVAIAAVAAVGTDLAGVDLVPLPGGGWSVIEVNGAVDFTLQYRRDRDVFEAAVEALLGAAAVAARARFG
jgi:glutathione synthase/RimK-type ligase-like ATP-grasp enzyme